MNKLYCLGPNFNLKKVSKVFTFGYPKPLENRIVTQRGGVHTSRRGVLNFHAIVYIRN